MVTLDTQAEHKVRVVISCGLVALAACVAIAVVVGNRVAPRIEQQLGLTPIEQPRANGISYDTFKNAPLNTIPVNEEASREIKKGPQQSPKNDPSSFVSVPTNQRCSVALFVSTDQQSQALLDWFNRDTSVAELKKRVNFQAYTRDNPLYKSRYSSIIPADQFPAVVFSAPDGGHIYVAARSQLPASASQLMKSMQDAFEVFTTARQQQPVNAGEAPALEVNAPDCPDGSCTPADREPFFTPEQSREPLFPLLKKPEKPSIESLFYWMWNPGEAVLAMCCAALFALILLVVFVKVMRS